MHFDAGDRWIVAFKINGKFQKLAPYIESYFVCSLLKLVIFIILLFFSTFLVFNLGFWLNFCIFPSFWGLDHKNGVTPNLNSNSAKPGEKGKLNNKAKKEGNIQKFNQKPKLKTKKVEKNNKIIKITSFNKEHT